MLTKYTQGIENTIQFTLEKYKIFIFDPKIGHIDTIKKSWKSVFKLLKFKI